MVVGVKEKSDVDYEKTADLIINGKRFENQNVYGDKEAPKRRDVFPDDAVRDRYPKRLPEKAKARWMGKLYPARLSFRYGRGGRAIPVYQFFVK